MLRIRRVEERIAQLYHEQEMRCPTHLCIGQEAIAVGVCANLTKKDIVFSTHRSHGHYLAKGGNLAAMIAEIYGKKTGTSGGLGGSMHLVDLRAGFWGAAPIVASTIPVAAGVAFARKLQKKSGIAVAFFGDAAVEEGVTHETMNYASLKKLPILFVCENNLYSTNTRLNERQPNRSISALPRAHGITAWQGDGNDVINVVDIAKEATLHIRSGKGPAFVEFSTYRYIEHCGPNEDPESLRSRRELVFWRKKDPIAKLKQYLIEKRYIGYNEIEKMETMIQWEIDRAFLIAKESPFPNNSLSAPLVYAS